MMPKVGEVWTPKDWPAGARGVSKWNGDSVDFVYRNHHNQNRLKRVTLRSWLRWVREKEATCNRK